MLSTVDEDRGDIWLQTCKVCEWKHQWNMMGICYILWKIIYSTNKAYVIDQYKKYAGGMNVQTFLASD